MVNLTLTEIGLLAVAFVILLVLAMGARRRILLRIGLRNVTRRKAQVGIAVAGLLVATSIVSGSLIVGDSFDASVRNLRIAVLDQTDELLVLQGQNETLQLFPHSVYEDLRTANLPHVDGLAARIEVGRPIRDLDSELFRPQAVLVGFDPAADLGLFTLADGTKTTGEALGPSEAYINAELAEELDAKVGHRLQVFIGLAPTNFTISAIVANVGRGAWDGDALFLRLDALQAALGIPGMINQVHISNQGGPAEGYLLTAEVVAEVQAFLPPGHPYTLVEVKRENIEQAQEEAGQLAQLFTLMGTFTIVAGLMLIVNIFTMLAEERKAEMGIERALGLKRRHLTFTFVAEGLVYALTSAALGTIAGLGVAYVVLWFFGEIFSSSEVRFVFALEVQSLLQAFSLGFLLTMTTVTLASWRVSRLNIVRAIRDVPEPVPRRSTWQEQAVGSAMALGGLYLSYLGYWEKVDLLFMVGPSLLALGLAVLAMRRATPRFAFTTAGAFMLVWLLIPIDLLAAETEPGIEIFVAIGLLLVLAGVLVVMFNSEILLAAADKAASLRRKLLPVMRTAIAYPANKRFRTAMTLAIFALIFFTITVMGMIMAMFNSSVETQTLQQSGGYDILAITSPSTPGGAVGWDSLVRNGLSGRIADFLDLTHAQGLAYSSVVGRQVAVDLYGIDDHFATSTGLTFYQMDSNYSTGRQVWEALMADPGLVVVHRNFQPQNFGPSEGLFRAGVGDTIELATPLGLLNRTYRIAGILDQFFLGGIFIQRGEVASFAGVSNPTVFYFEAAQGELLRSLAHDLERSFLPYGMVTFIFRDFMEEVLRTTLAIMQLLQGFLALGLLVGIAGLGIIAMRNVVERRSETGALRALGFRRSMVLEAFLIEMTFVIVLGLAIGVVLGLAVSYNLYQEFFADIASFDIPWTNLGLIGLLAYGASILATLSPGRRAARMPPAEALRRVE